MTSSSTSPTPRARASTSWIHEGSCSSPAPPWTGTSCRTTRKHSSCAFTGWKTTDGRELILGSWSPNPSFSTRARRRPNSASTPSTSSPPSAPNTRELTFLQQSMATEATDAAGTTAARTAPTASNALNIATWQYPQNIKRSFQNIARIHPTIKVSRGDGPIVKLHLAEEKLGKLEVAKASITDPALTVRGVMHATNTDAVLVMHNGRILWEKYNNTMTSLTDHLL